MSTEITIAPVLVDKLPEFTKELYPRFVQFMRDYIAFLEKDENFLRIALDWQHNIEPSNNVEPYIDALLKDLGFESGQSLAVDKNLMLHFLRDFYLARGSEASFKFLFRALFNEDVSIQYPRDKLLVPSYASYGERHFIFTSAVNRDTLQYQSLLNYVRENGGVVRGLASGVEAAIENITIQHGSGTPYMRIEILLPNHEFYIAEDVLIEGGDFVISETVKPVLDIEITDPGYGYLPNDIISITGPSLQGQATIESVSKGGVTGFSLPSNGGWEVGDKIKAHPNDGGFGFSAFVTEVDGSGNITKTKVYNTGYNYSKIPSITISNENQNAKLTGTSVEIGGLQTVKVVAPYVDFTNCTFTITSQKGTGAVLKATPKSRWSYNDWTDKKGVIGENSTLIDSDKYQQYSYTIVSSILSSNYDNFVSEMLHPAGYTKSSSYEIVSHLSLTFTGGDISIGGSESFEYESVLNLPFIATHEIDSMVMIVTDSILPITTDSNIEMIVSE